MIKLNNILNESPDNIRIKDKENHPVKIINFPDGICTFLIYKHGKSKIVITGIGYNQKSGIVISNDSSIKEKIESMKYKPVFSRFEHLPTHYYLEDILDSTNNSDYLHHYESLIRGRLFEYKNKYYITIWEKESELKKYSSEIKFLMNELNIKEDDLYVEIKSRIPKNIPYLEFMKNDNKSNDTNSKEQEKIRDLRIAHERKALLNKELKDFLDNTPKTNIELFKQLEKKFGVPVAKLRTLKNKPLDVLLKKKVKELISEIKLTKLNEAISTKQAKTALEFIKQLIKGSEYENNVFLAGGAVRDQIMGKDPKDLDFVVRGKGINSGIEFAEWATRKMNNYKKDSNPVVYPKFGTAKFELRNIKFNGVDLSQVEIEVVAPRKEEYIHGSRKPTVTSGDLKDDVYRRDLTVNSLLRNVSTGEILDLTGNGINDIKKGIVRSPSNPDVIFNEDPLRMLRAVRFTYKYNWDLPKEMINSMRKNASQLKNISNERIQDELNKILQVTSVDKAIKLLKITNLLYYIIPEFKDAVGMTQNKYHNKDVFGHTLDVLKKTKPDVVNRLMALFHDIGKTVTKSVTPEGDVHFYGHEDAGADIVEKRLKELKYPNEIVDAVKKGVRYHMRLKHGGDDGTGISDKTLRKFKTELGDVLESTLDVIDSDNNAHSELGSMPNQIKNIKIRLDNLKDEIKNDKPELPVSGNDLKTELGLKPGPMFGKILNFVLDLWYENPKITKEEAIIKIKSEFNL